MTRTDLKHRIDLLELKKQILEGQLDQADTELRARRAELDRMERCDPTDGMSEFGAVLFNSFKPETMQ